MKLHVLSGPLAGRVTEVDRRLVVGREEGCDLVLEDEKVSRRHCAFSPLPDGSVSVEDLGSSNGTFVGGERIAAPATVLGGEEVRVGSTVLRLEGERPAVAATVVGDPSRTVVGAPSVLASTSGSSGDGVPGSEVPWWRRWRVLAAVAGLLVAGGIAGGVVAATTGGGDEEAIPVVTEPPQPQTVTVTQPAETEPPPETGAPVETGVGSESFPNAAEAALLEHVPEDQHTSCTRPTIPEGDPLADPSLGALAIVLYALPNGISAVYMQMDSAESMTAAYDRLGVAGTDRDSGDCSQAVPAEQSYTVDGEPVGRLTCFEVEAPDGQGTRLLFWWTHDPLTILSFAFRSDGDLAGLYDWWANEAGPV